VAPFQGVSRRQFLLSIGIAAIAPAFLGRFHELAASERKRARIRDIQVMVMQGPRTYTLVKVVSDTGVWGIGESYGSPGAGVKEQILLVRPSLIGKDTLDIDTLFSGLGNRTDGSAHSLMRAVSGIKMAVWDLAGKILEVPTSTLLGGKFRDKTRVYDHTAPTNQLDKKACADWAAEVKASPAGFTCHKFSPQPDPLSAGGGGRGRGAGRGAASSGRGGGAAGDEGGGRGGSRVLSARQIMNIQQGWENVREAAGWDRDVMVHCSWNYDLRTSIQIADAVAPIKPVWLEDPMAVPYTESWKRLTEVSKTPICMGENLVFREQFMDFIMNVGADIIHPDLRNTGGFLPTSRVAQLASLYGLPMATHNTGSQVNTYAAAQWAGSIKDYIALETITGQGDWMDKVLLLPGSYIKDGFIEVHDRPGLGIELNPDVVRAHLAPGETWWG
jgi:L-alanine-DL-glutamate epimerase-like enolase superfamily enzyme